MCSCKGICSPNYPTDCKWHCFTSRQHDFSTSNMAHFFSLTLIVLTWTICDCDVGEFSPCLQFFYRSWPPKGLAGTPICQRYQNQYRFATLYSRPRRSPWFSAYVYTVPTGKRPTPSWKFEPQVSVGLTPSFPK